MSLQLPYLPPGSTFPPILNTKTDIATSLDLEQMRIRAPGRIPFQIVHLWSPPSKKKSVLKYDADTDCPKTNRHLRIPTELELIPAGEDEEGKTSAYLEIGLALSQPRDEYPLLVLKDRIEAAQSVHNNQNQNQTSKSSTKKGLLPRLPKTLRVFTPLSKNYVHPQTRCVIGVHFENGRFHPRKIGVDAVFFYPEFWYQTSFEESLAKRRNGVGLAVRFRAVCYEAGSGVVASSARDAEMGHVREIEELKDEEEEDSDHDSDDDSEEDIPEEDPTSTTTKEEGVTKAQIQRYEYIHRLPGVSSWHRFDETFSREDAKLLVAELKRSDPSLRPLSIPLILRVHTCLRSTPRSDSPSHPSKRRLCHNFPRGMISLFLDACHDFIIKRAMLDDRYLELKVRQVLREVARFQRGIGRGLWEERL